MLAFSLKILLVGDDANLRLVVVVKASGLCVGKAPMSLMRRRRFCRRRHDRDK